MDINSLLTSSADVVVPTNTQYAWESNLNLPQQLPSISCPSPEQPVSAITRKRAASPTPASKDEPLAKQLKWTAREDGLTIELRGKGIEWEKRLPGRSSVSEKCAVWDEEKKNRFAHVYDRFKEPMWQMVGTEMGIPWRTAEAMHWQLGEDDMIAHANAALFELHSSNTFGNIDTEGSATSSTTTMWKPTDAAANDPPVMISQPVLSLGQDDERSKRMKPEEIAVLGASVKHSIDFESLIGPAPSLRMPESVPESVPVPHYFCTFCHETGKEITFKAKSDWKKHELAKHASGLEYRCGFPGCDEAFDRSFPCKTHMQTEHNMSFQGYSIVQNPYLYVCGFEDCGARSDKIDDHCDHVAYHMKLGHSDWTYSSTVRSLLKHPDLEEPWRLMCATLSPIYNSNATELLWGPTTSGMREQLHCFNFGDFGCFLVDLFEAGVQGRIEFEAQGSSSLTANCAGSRPDS